MVQNFSRRNFLKTVGASAVVLGFDATNRSWVTEAHAQSAGLDHVPHFDGQLVVDPAALEAAADDFGHIVHRVPVAVLRPGSAEDIARAIHYAGARGIQVAARGQGHSGFGQAQVEGGLVIDMSTLSTIHSIGDGIADVDAGALWSDLIRAGVPHGLTPPVSTDYIDLSVGGTLSMAGVGARSFQHGMQVDNVLELEVVTGRGERTWCSRERNTGLFYAALGSLGQFAIIVRARLKMAAAPANARYYAINYSRLEDFVGDQAMLAHDGRFDGIEGSFNALPAGGWSYQIQATKFFDATPPDDAALLAGLHDDGGATHTDSSYLDWANRLAPLVALLKQVGAWYVPHAWFDVFIPGSKVVPYLASVLAELTPADTGGGPVLLRPLLRRREHTPLVAVPDEETFFLFDILRFAIPPTPEEVQRELDQNRRFWDRAAAIGGKRYPVGAIPFTQADWRQQYGTLRYLLMEVAKRFYDPRRILTPGPGIF